ncbi:MAG: nucleotide exchange factor GrpE [Methanomicrobiales archaeon]|nr:nucleotide exchange factor GrpE [Methanomicrobiales archaeon]MDD1662294.1 nucleotide exchange factor GrpE [Methanomicrobiales archaeon]
MTGEESGQDTDPQQEIARLKGELDEARKLAEDRLIRLQYLQADFDNYRKSLEREREQVIQLAGETLVRDLLPVLDDLERALPSLTKEKNREGFEILSRKLQKILESHGLRSIESHGKRFDPNFHEAIAKGESSEEDGTILEEYQRGYLLRSKVIRPSKVKIAEHTGECKEENHGKGEDHRD